MTSHLFLSGPMGSGKSTVGRLAAERLGRPFIDLDRAIEAREGEPVAAIFRARGEIAFRSLERDAAREVALREEPVVCALGGGTVIDADTRALLLDRGLVVTLSAGIDVLVERTSGDENRPLLATGTDRHTTLAGIVRMREAAYAEAHEIIDTSALSPDEVAARVVALMTRAPILVPAGTGSYRALVTHGLAPLHDLVGETRASRVIVVTDTNAAPHAARVCTALDAHDLVRVELAPGEEHKTIASVERIWDAALEARVDRSALVLAVGGGVVGDVAGFAAATLLRGVPVAHVPTTLLSMVDSAIGGKTGVDRSEGKNLVGAFHAPRFVLADLSSLDTLPERELRAGLAEVVKSAWIAGEAEVRSIERDSGALLRREPDALERAIRMSLRLKARIVAVDPLERGMRAHLNLGHTVGHAIETESGYALRHGEAVALGLVAALRVGRALGDASGADLARMTRLLEALGLPVDLDARFGAGAAARIGADKKRAGDRIRFVVPGPPGRIRVEPLDEARIRGLVSAA